jgi:hypothetical protein
LTFFAHVRIDSSGTEPLLRRRGSRDRAPRPPGWAIGWATAHDGALMPPIVVFHHATVRRMTIVGRAAGSSVDTGRGAVVESLGFTGFAAHFAGGLP